MEPEDNSPANTNERLAKTAFAAMALLSVLAGLALYLLQPQIGISEDTARLVSTAFILVGIADTIVLFLWNRIFSGTSKHRTVTSTFRKSLLAVIPGPKAHKRLL